MWADALTKEMEMHRDMRALLTEGDFALGDDGLNKVQYKNGKMKMFNIRNRNKNGTSSTSDTWDILKE